MGRRLEYADANERGKAYQLRLKVEVIDVYGGHCVCCEEEQLEFLSIDHMNDSKVNRTHPSGKGGRALYSWLRRNGFPKEDFRVLCMNCNTAIGFFGYCPHQVAEEFHLRDRLMKIDIDRFARLEKVSV